MQLQQLQKKDNWIAYGLLGGIILFSLLFFGVLHPYIFLDGDDWFYLTFTRHAVPIWGAMEPTKVFSELGMSLSALLAHTLLEPLWFVEDFVEATKHMNTLVVTFFVTAYGMACYYLGIHRGKLSKATAASFTVIFLLFHFLIFRKHLQGNDYLFHTSNVTCLYQYLLPMMMNAIMVMVCLCLDLEQLFLRKNSYYGKGFLLLGMLLALWSHLFASCLLGAYLGARLSWDVIGYLRKKNFVLKNYLSSHKIHLCFLGLFLLTQLFEANGQRADSVRNGNFFKEVLDTLRVLWNLRRHLAPVMILFMVVLSLLVIVRVAQKMHATKKPLPLQEVDGILLLTECFQFLYLVLLGGACGHFYYHRSEVVFGLFFVGFLLLLRMLTFLVHECPWLQMFLPLLCVIFFVECNTTLVTYQENNILKISPDIVMEIDRDILSQFREAEALGQGYVELKVPMADTKDNWPFTTYSKIYYAACAYRYGITDQLMNCTNVIPTKEKNQEFHLDGIHPKGGH